MRVASIQLAVIEGPKTLNLDHAAEKILQAQGADLVILPELWNIGFLNFERYHAEAEGKSGPTLTLLRQLAKQLKVYIHSGSLVEVEGGRYYNSSYLISPDGELVGAYRKIHLFGYQSREATILEPGDRLSVVDTSLAKVGMAICYDLRFPELFRHMTDQGAEVFLVTSAWPYPRLEHWIMLNRVRALENQCFLVSSNSVGPCAGGAFVGHSMIVNPWGVIMASGGDEETILYADLDLQELQGARARFPALADRVGWLNPGLPEKPAPLP